MTDRELKLKLKALAGVKSASRPDALWISETRNALLAKARAEFAVPEVSPVVLPQTAMNRFMFVLRPVMAGFMVIGFAVAGWAAGVSSSFRLADKGSAPLKTAAEYTQLTFSADPAARAYLHLELAGRRANEVAALAESDSAGREGDVKAAMDQLQSEIVSVKMNLDEISSSKSDSSSAVAKAVDRKVAEIHAVFGKTKNLLSKDAQAKAEEVEAAADDVSIKAVAVLVAGAKTDADKTDAAARVQDKIDSAEKDMRVASTEAGDQAKAALAAAKAALAKDDLAQAITKVQEASVKTDGAAAEVQVAQPAVNANAPASQPAATGKIKAIDF